MRSQAVDWPRPPLPASERRRLRVVGLIAGALVGAGTALVTGGLLTLVLTYGVASILGFFITLLFPSLTPPSLLELLLDPALLGPIVLGLLLGPLSWSVSWLCLRRWGAGRALGVTAAAGVLAWLGGLAGGGGALALAFWLDADQYIAAHPAALLAAGLIGAVLGALAGWGGWVWLGHLMRPRAQVGGGAWTAREAF